MDHGFCLCRHVVSLVDEVLRGAKVSCRSSNPFELVVNLNIVCVGPAGKPELR